MSECILWTKSRSHSGYGLATRDGKTRSIHRWVYSQAFGEIPEGLCVLHKCDVKNCVNPDHLFLGTHQDNADDRGKKGRSARNFGEKHGRHKLTEVEALIIIESPLSYMQLAECFDVSKAAIAHIKERRNWKYLSEVK